MADMMFLAQSIFAPNTTGENFSLLLDIPPEVWAELLSHLSDAKTLLSLSTTCKQALAWTTAHESISWKAVFKAKFPLFFECLEEKEKEAMYALNWRQLTQDVYEGRRSFRVQVFNRESHPGFRMSCYDADATYRKEDGQVNVKYLAPLDRTEVAPLSRCRKAPEDVFKTHSDSFSRYSGGDLLPLKKDDVVEVQWRSIPAHPFGWWHGEVEGIEGSRVKLIFKQFDKQDIFYTISFEMPGMRAVQQTPGSGNYGGIRLVPKEEHKAWMDFWEINPSTTTTTTTTAASPSATTTTSTTTTSP
jgi:hypothetical protein